MSTHSIYQIVVKSEFQPLPYGPWVRNQAHKMWSMPSVDSLSEVLYLAGLIADSAGMEQVVIYEQEMTGMFISGMTIHAEWKDGHITTHTDVAAEMLGTKKPKVYVACTAAAGCGGDDMDVVRVYQDEAEAERWAREDPGKGVERFYRAVGLV